MTDRRKESAEVVHCAEEYTADNDPEEYRQPAEDCSLNGTVDGARSCDRGEVVAHQHSGVGGDVVVVVEPGVCRRLACRVNSPLLGKPRAVEDIAQSEKYDADGRKE